MTNPEDAPKPTPEPSALHRRYPYGPGYSRLLAAGAAVVVGIVLVIKCAGGLGGITGDATVLFPLSLVLVAVGVAGIFLARWMARRGY